MAAIRTTTNKIVTQIFHPSLSLGYVRMFRTSVPSFGGAHRIVSSAINYIPVRCASSDSGHRQKKPSARLSQVQQLLFKAEERALSACNEPVPKIPLGHVTVSFARSGGPGGQNLKEVNTKLDVRFNVKNAHWLSERARERIMQMEKNRINKQGEIVISSMKTRTQKCNIADALRKLQVLRGKLKAIVDAASHVLAPHSEEQGKKIAKLAAIGEQKRLQNKKVLSQKESFRKKPRQLGLA